MKNVLGILILSVLTMGCVHKDVNIITVPQIPDILTNKIEIPKNTKAVITVEDILIQLKLLENLIDSANARFSAIRKLTEQKTIKEKK